MIKSMSLAFVAMVALAFAVPASAFELGSTDFNLDNTATVGYNLDAEEFDAVLETELNYTGINDIKLYTEATFDVEAGLYTGLEAGVEYTPVMATGLTLATYATYDSEWDRTAAIVEAEYKF